MNVPLAVKMTIQERRVERRQGQRRQADQELAQTESTISFFRGLIVGCFTTLTTVAILWVIWRVANG